MVFKTILKLELICKGGDIILRTMLDVIYKYVYVDYKY